MVVSSVVWVRHATGGMDLPRRAGLVGDPAAVLAEAALSNGGLRTAKPTFRPRSSPGAPLTQKVLASWHRDRAECSM